MNRKKIYLFIFIVASLAISMEGLNSKELSDNELVQEIETYIKEKIPANGPGAAVLVLKNDRPIMRKGYGMANLELGVGMRPEMVFRIGSISKQFTAASILMLVEKNRISLDDNIRKYIPDYPTRGCKITIHHLLSHTSGIKSYDDLPQIMANLKKNLTPQQFINMFKNEPLDFKPGTRFKYSNSGYYLLGIIIEKVSGISYAEFIRTRIFEPLGMKNSYYDSYSRIIPNRASGYRPTKNGFVNAEYFNTTFTYAAGSLLSNVDDLWTWTRALHAGKVVSKAHIRLMTTPVKYASGKTQNYGYGLWLKPLFGEKKIDHNGGIFGFLTYVSYLPEKDIFVAVLTNALVVADAPFMGQWIAALLCGKDVKRKKAIHLETQTTADIVGVYEISKGIYRTITLEGNTLYCQRTGRSKRELLASSKNEFFFKDSFTYFSMMRNKKGQVIKMVKHGDGPDEEAYKTNQRVKTRKAIKLNVNIFNQYMGVYRSGEGIEITIRLKNNQFYAQLKGQPEFEIYPESKDKFFFKVADAQLVFIKNDQGKVIALDLNQGGRTLKLRRQ